jgi:hypothetical protein
MKLRDKRTWDRVIYGLVYPGFLGSMLYELIPTKDMDFTWSYFFGKPVNYIRYLILIFYFLDYMHLYGDMESAMKEDPNEKDFSYFACDILTCLIYLFSFIALKIPNYEWTICGFGAIPWLFLWYKRKNPADIRFFLVYGCFATLIAVCRVIGIFWWKLIPISGQTLALLVMILNVGVYGFYVSKYYDWFSAENDRKRFNRDARARA